MQSTTETNAKPNLNADPNPYKKSLVQPWQTGANFHRPHNPDQMYAE